MRLLTGLTFFFSIALAACSPTLHFTDGPPQQPADMAAQPDAAGPPVDMASKPPVRISKLDDDYWWWKNPLDPGTEDYVSWVNGPLNLWAGTAPSSYRPRYDNQLRVRCLYYVAADQKWRCLPGWAQIARPTLPLDGFYAAGDWQCPLVNPRTSWVQLLPRAGGEDNSQPYLVLFDTKAGGYRVYEKVPVRVPVWVRDFQLCTQIWDEIANALTFYTAGAEVPLDRFAEPLGGGMPE